MQFPGVTVFCVNAMHGDNEETAAIMGEGFGFVFVSEGEKTIYSAGDTVYYDGVREIIERFRPDVIIVNACDARGRTGSLIMNGEDVMKTCECAPFSTVISSHMDTVSHAHLSRRQLGEMLSGTKCQLPYPNMT